jgi:type II secretory pathway component PulF
MNFAYTAKSVRGERRSGVIEADSLQQARQRLRGDGLFPLSLTQADSVSRSVRAMAARDRRVTKADLMMLTAQLAIMCTAGVDLADALRNAALQCPNLRLRRIVEAIHADVSSGSAVSAALARHVAVFGNAYVASVAAGEASGQVPEVLKRLAGLLRNEIRMRNSLRAVLTYPVVLSVVAAVVVTVLVFFVLPQFAEVFADLGTPPPPQTQLLFEIAEFARARLLWFAGAAFALSVLGVRLMRTERARWERDRLMLSAAGLGHATRSLLAGRAFSMLGTLLESNIPLLEALRICRSSINNRLFREMFLSLEESVISGSGIGPALSTVQIIPQGAAVMLTTAEKTGQLASVMQSVGEFYEDEGEQKIREMVKLVEPAIIVVMGVLVAGVVLTVMLPLLDVSTISGK